ncbi:midasin-like isoform X2 [Nematostella vectensis]|uniref:midasin-like isoform X2 n=1 Tax=Nematostella vectensis TaxID=45351 RepID=UPI002076E1D8|nr:midasin-like isoform X2 [Nematostella vectensis]
MDMTQDFAFEFRSALVCLGNVDKELNNLLVPFLDLKTWNHQDKQYLLKRLAQQMFNKKLAPHIIKNFTSVTLEILQQTHVLLIETNQKDLYIQRHEIFSHELSLLLPRMDHIREFVHQYFDSTPSFMFRLTEKQHPTDDIIIMILETACNFLSHDLESFKECWNFGSVFPLINHSHPKIKWLAFHVVSMVSELGENDRMTLIDKLFTVEERNKLMLKFNSPGMKLCLDEQQDLNSNELSEPPLMDVDQNTDSYFTKEDLSGNYTAICGVILPSLQKQALLGPHSCLSMVPSTQRNLHSLVLAVAAGSGVLLEGPVGSGKTCLVEHVASMCGRSTPPEIMKVQLGDQTDGKSLLGTYVCTDTPGEFVWQPGTLLRAVIHGHWVLLEDIDYAPMDVVSLLIPLLESRTLSVPGHGNVVKAVPGFQLFATQRISSGGLSVYAHTNSSLLDRLWRRVYVEPLSKEELVQIICEKYPNLESVAAKLVDVYCMVSSDPTLSATADTTHTSLSHDKRLSTARDLMKWACRVDMVTSNSPLLLDARDVFLEALDCFCATLSKVELRFDQAMALGAKLGLTKEKIEFFCSNYKPKVHTSPLSLTVGRITLNRSQSEVQPVVPRFAHTRHSLVLLERVAACINQQEPVLLVGETGTGKTSSVQTLAAQCGHNLKVINMSQQSDSADLLGGFKPVEMKQLVRPVKEEFERLFNQTFSRKQNVKFLSHVQRCYTNAQWEVLFKLMTHSLKGAAERIAKGSAGAPKASAYVLSQWQKLGQQLKQLRKQQKHAESALAFRFVEGMLVKAVRNGDWVLLDEINLAMPETLECLSGLLESSAGSVVLLERGDVEAVTRHDDFRLFACMNPATDVGKKDLPPGIRNRFTEIFVDELEDLSDLKILVVDYLKSLSLSAAVVDGIVRFYLKVRREASEKLTDGTGHKPHYSLRTLCRALRYASTNPHGNAVRSIYEGFCLSFLTQLDRSSHPVVLSLIRTHILGHVNAASLLNQPLPKPKEGSQDFVNFEGFWVAMGQKPPEVPSHYVLTRTVKENLRDLARVVSGRSFPVLLQGETSVGKTSLITWLASTSGNHCVRINNHEHTDIQEYIGCYTSDQNGRLVFKEGVLVDAMRKGYWIILDELNLAPTDVLEALNRLLDDNRELFIPETQETVKAHPKFMLFATQNPPGQYGGRKVLSRAFRNRFVELHFDELPSKELEVILHERGSLPMSYAKKLVSVLLDLQARRRSTSVFAGKQGFITLRDLFRWAERYSKTPDVGDGFHDWEHHLAQDGYMLLSGRCRHPDECQVIREVMEHNFKRKLNPQALFGDDSAGVNIPLSASSILDRVIGQKVPGFGHVVWTHNMRRLAVLVWRALQFGEPVLLVGETGCGKTTICQLFAALTQQNLFSVNCHMHSESSDFLGGLRPVRQRSQQEQDDKVQKFFEWCDGPLVLAMKGGAMFLVDEISLADDSVLERLNSVLEPERTLVLAEKGSEGEGVGNRDVDVVVAHEKFRVVSTMNPGGDFGKKELSPALRNRFTEIWCPSTDNREDLISIIDHNLTPGITLSTSSTGSSGFGEAMMDFIEWFHAADFGKRFVFSIRDLLSWVSFINTCCSSLQSTIHPEGTVSEDHMEIDGHVSIQSQPIRSVLDPPTAYIHGACLVFLDSLGAGVSSFGSSMTSPYEARKMCLDFLEKQMAGLGDLADGSGHDATVRAAEMFGISPFFIPKGPKPIPEDLAVTYALSAPTTSQNATRILRALQLPRPILLEGSPGVGKTSLVSAIAKASGHELVRINLSEQTDITDLFGADLPMEGGEPGQFCWRDGPLLRALKAGHWVVLDELNLASQSVLEGLNACLDHRAEVYIPELGMSFNVQHEKTRMFACQNPLNQGGGRKGLPKSFLNRFTQVYVEALSMEDLMFITQSMYPQIHRDILHSMITFNTRLHQETVIDKLWGSKGSPWEFNLRDVFRWCDLLIRHQVGMRFEPGQFVKMIYSDRMRTASDKVKVLELFREIFSDFQYSPQNPMLHVTASHIQVGHSFLPRSPCIRPTLVTSHPLQMLHHHLPYMESLMKCLEMNWMAVLIGPRSCGKTSLVRMVAGLTSSKLDVMTMNSAMDTTELLGGFEQADLNRHWEDVVSRAAHVVTDTIREVLVRTVGDGPQVEGGKTGSLTEVVNLYNNWRAFMKINTKSSKSESRTSEGLTNTRMQALLHVMSLVLETRRQAHLPPSPGDEVHDSILALKCQYESNQNNTHCGGQFEWVDGQLVQALKTGSWLLIDNVNFCSPSVLDRLNALLEPGGTLSINERGVIDGEVPAVTPHPDFRLILTMDPKFGEISRAMRNRGVEIYVSGEDEEQGYDNHDRHAMMSGVGLLDPATRQHLLDLHRAYQEKLGGSLLDLLHASSMISDLTQRGLDMRSAMKTAVTQVYVRSQPSDRERLIAEELCDRHHSLTCQSNAEVITKSYPGPSIHDFVTNTSLATIMQHCAPLLQLLCQRESPKQRDHAVTLVTERATFRDWQLRRDLLCHVLMELPDASDVGHVMSAMASTLETVFTSIAMQRLQGITHQLGQMSNYPDLANHPYDLRLNGHLTPRLLMSCQGRRDEIKELIQKMESVTNRLQLLAERARHSQQMSAIISNTSIKVQSKGLLKYSMDFHSGLLSSEALSHPVVAHLYPFFLTLTRFIERMILLDMPLSEQQASEVSVALTWSDRFLEVCSAPSPQFSLSSLSLHWQWFVEKTLAVVPHILGQATDSSLPSELVTLIKELSAHLGSDNRLAKMHLRLLYSHGHPVPYQTQDVHDQWQHLSSLSKLLEISIGPEMTDYSKRRLNAQLKFLASDGIAARGLLLAAMIAVLNAKHATGQYGSAQDLIERINTLLSTQGLLTNQSADPMADVNHSIVMASHDQENECGEEVLRDKELSCSLISLYPLFYSICPGQEFAVLEQLTQMLMEYKHQSPTDQSKMEALETSRAFIQYAVRNTTRCPVTLACYASITAATKDEDVYKLASSLESEVILSAMLARPPVDVMGVIRHHMGSSGTEDNTHETCPKQSADAFSYHLLTRTSLDTLTSNKKPSSDEGDPLFTVTIGNHKDKQHQLATIGQHLWRNNELIDAGMTYQRSNSMHLLVSKLSQVINSLAAIADGAATISRIQNVCRALIHSLQSHSLPSLGDAKDGVLVLLPDVCEKYRAVCKDGRSASLIRVLILDVMDKIADFWNGQECDVLLGGAWSRLGLLQTILLSPVGPADPMEQNALELLYAREEIANIKEESKVRLDAEQIWTGTRASIDDLERRLYETACVWDSSLTSNPVRMAHLQTRWKELREEELRLAQYTALRPQNSQYDAILSSVKHYSATIGNPDNVLALLQQIEQLVTSQMTSPTTRGDVTTVLSRVQSWRASMKHFISHMAHSFTYYNDVIMPFLAGAAQVVYGVSRACEALDRTVEQQAFLTKSPAVSPTQTWSPVQLMQHLCFDVSCAGPWDDFRVTCSMDCIQALLYVTDLAQESRDRLQTYFATRILWSALLSLRNAAFRSGYLDNRTVQRLLALYNKYLQKWSQAKEEEQRREQEDGSIYKYKSTSHGSDLTENRAADLDLCLAFPSYDDEFSDLNPSNSLEEVLPKQDVAETSSLPTSGAQQFMELVNMRQITAVHELLFSSLPTQRKLALNSGLTVDKLPRKTDAYHQEALQAGYQTASVVSCACELARFSPESNNWEAHLIHCNSMSRRLAAVTSTSGKHYDVYHDANIPEVTRARAVLLDLTSRINELLAEWPGNPLLTQLQLFVERILSLPVTSPVMKVLTGVELLLKNAQEWEANASRHVSIKAHLDALTQLIISWRKLELRCWSSLLEVATEKVAEKASHWWFYLYGLLLQVEEGLRSNHQTDSESLLVEPLQKFIESSSLGEFAARMSMLHAFYNQYNSAGEISNDKIAAIMLNVYMYYKQFSPSVEQTIKHIRDPIEKELKDYVKIAKWNDANFWAMKQAAEKSHRTLHKFVSRYEQSLSEPIRRLLTDTKTVLGVMEKDITVSESHVKVEAEWFLADEALKISSHPSTALDLLSALSHMQMPSVAEQLDRYPKLFTRMRKLCHNMLSQQEHPRLVESLDELTGEIIESVHELQSLSVDSQPKEKRKEARKHIHLRKRKALAELFKTLQTIGLSYRKGLNLAHQQTTKDSPLLLPSLDPNTLHGATGSKQSRLTQSFETLFNGCQHYYHRCLARSAAMSTTMSTPSKELTLGDVERCRGFSHHLLDVVLAQRTIIAGHLDSLATLRLGLRSLSGVSAKQAGLTTGLPPQRDLRPSMEEAMQLLIDTSEALQHLSLLMDCCPLEAFTPDSSPVPANLLSNAAKASAADPMMINIKEDLVKWQDTIQRLLEDVMPIAAVSSYHATGSDDTRGSWFLATWEHLLVLRRTFKKLEQMSKQMEAILPDFNSSLAPGNGFGSRFSALVQKLQIAIHRFRSNDSPKRRRLLHSTESARLLSSHVEKTVTSLLLGVQKLVKAGTEAEQPRLQTDNTDMDEEFLLDGHLTTHIHANLVNEVSKLDLATVKDNVHALICCLHNSAESSNNTSTARSHMEEKTSEDSPKVPDTLTSVPSPDFISSINADKNFKDEEEPNSESILSDGGVEVSSSLVLSVLPLLTQYLSLSENFLHRLLASHRSSTKLLSVLLAVFTELAANGFCLPPEVDEEEGGEGATEFEDIEGGGLGEGEGAKDVSDQIESEDQLQDTKQEGQKEEKQDAAQQQIPDEENAIEMSDDIDGALHDVPTEEKEEGGDDDKEEEEPDLDKQMGEVDGQEDETLDEKMWGDSDDEDEDKEEKESKEEKGAGAEAESESTMVAKEDNKDAVDKSKDKDDVTQPDDTDDVHELPKDEEDHGNLSDEEQPEPQGEGIDETAPPVTEEDIQLPEDLQLDDQGEDHGSEQGDEVETVEDVDMDKDEEMPGQNDTPGPDENMDQEEGGQGGEEQEDKEEEEEDEVRGQESTQGEEDEAEDERNIDIEDWKTNHQSEDQEAQQAVEDLGKNDNSQNRNEAVEAAAGQSEPAENEDKQGTGAAEAAGSEGHLGEADTSHAQTAADAKQKSQQRKQMNRSRSDRSLGSTDDRTHKRLKTVDEQNDQPSNESDTRKISDLYQHMRDEYGLTPDAQTLDSATADQAKEQDSATFPDEKSDGENVDIEEDVPLWKDNEEKQEAQKHQRSLPQATDTEMKPQEDRHAEAQDEERDSVKEKNRQRSDVERLRSTYHVSESFLAMDKQGVSLDADKLRSDLEHQLAVWSHLHAGSRDEQLSAQEAWQKYELLTAGLAQELCEQLRLVLEPSLATKLRGDYRTGKRLNMRKVIPYIASQFRKDKIWLRRTKPSKRQYQIMVAVDDSSSMADNHSKQLAFESLAVISKALTRLEAGELGVCSFGESVKLLHPPHEPFTDQSGAKILQQFTFDQKKTKIAQLVDTCTSLMLTSRSRMQSGPRVDTSQLLLIVSDGRGVFLEGMETVLRTVRFAKEAGIFLVFVILDNPVNRDSVLDIRVPIFRPGKPPEIRSYMEQFPFPFYIILRDINALPVTLSDALRQWFELVTSMDS